MGIVVACAAMACSPTLNWRSHSASEDGFKAFFPGKPTFQARDITWQSIPMHMRMTSAGQGPSLFAVIVSARPRHRETEVLHFFRDRLLTHTAMTAKQADGRMPALPPAVRARAEFALSVRATRTAGSGAQAAQLLAHFVVVGERVYQIIALTGPAFAPTELEAFFGAFELISLNRTDTPPSWD
ncbi:MAG TPA: hypothetical protein PLQ67_00895 [Burkholderiaceae bacterium]|nr:hypothetical protein [Burkholderiaceae bacterium]